MLSIEQAAQNKQFDGVEGLIEIVSSEIHKDDVWFWRKKEVVCDILAGCQMEEIEAVLVEIVHRILLAGGVPEDEFTPSFACHSCRSVLVSQRICHQLGAISIAPCSLWRVWTRHLVCKVNL